MSASTLSWIISPFGLIGFLLGSEKKRWGWGLCIFSQLVWISFALYANIPGSTIGSAGWLVAYIKNFFGWEWKWISRLASVVGRKKPDSASAQG